MIVATPVLPEDHAPPDTVELNVVVPLLQIACVPLSEPADGAAVTVTEPLKLAETHPVTLDIVKAEGVIVPATAAELSATVIEEGAALSAPLETVVIPVPEIEYKSASPVVAE